MDAQISITGNVGTDVEVRPTRTSQPMATFRVASTPRYRSAAGAWTDGDTTWMTVRCYRWLADNVATSLRKGDPVVVVGRIRTAAWSDDKGVRHERAEIEASTVGHDLTRGTTHFRRADRPAPLEGRGGSEDGTTEQAAGAGGDAAAVDPWADTESRSDDGSGDGSDEASVDGSDPEGADREADADLESVTTRADALTAV